jgi:AraC-like DNA-binding protein
MNAVSRFRGFPALSAMMLACVLATANAEELVLDVLTLETDTNALVNVESGDVLTVEKIAGSRGTVTKTGGGALRIKLNRNRAAGDTHQTYVDNALRYIQYNYASNIGVADIARYVGISRSQLYRAFLQDFGVSPHAYLQTYRINEACSLLRDPAYSVAEVAGSVGFNDPLYFSRVFKSIKDVTPSDYQKKRRKGG